MGKKYDQTDYKRLIIKGQVWREIIKEEIQRLLKKDHEIEAWLLSMKVIDPPLQKGLPIEKNSGEYSKDFEDLWALYPARNGMKREKKSAYKAFLKLAKDRIKNFGIAVVNYSQSPEARRGYARDMVRFMKEDFWPCWIRPSEAMMVDKEDKFKKTNSKVENIVEGIIRDQKK